MRSRAWSSQEGAIDHRTARRRVAWVWIALAAFVPAIAAAQEGVSSGGGGGGTEIIRGHVRTKDGRPVEGASVTVTGLQTLNSRPTHTNDQGLYTVLFGDGEGQYVITVRQIGFAPVKLRVIRTGESNVLVADVTLDKAPVQLDSVTVVGRGGALARTDGRSIGGDERDATGGALFSLDPSDLSALAAAVPGVTYIPGVNGGPGSYSVLGASPDQNNVLLDGSTFGGNALPPDAIASASIATTTFDPARGQFSGGQLSIRTRRGTDLFDATFRGALADPHLAWADPASPTPIARNLNWSGTVSGPIKRGVAHFMAGYSNNVSTSDLQSLLSLNHTLLTQYGLSRDTVNALASTLGALGVPTTTGEIPSDNTRLNRSAIVRLDAAPTATTALTLTGTWGNSSQLGGGISALGFPSQGNENQSTNMGLQLAASGYVAGLVDELKTSVQSSSSHADPFLTLPKGSVRVGALYADGNSGITSLNFGGGTSGLSRNESRSWETSNELSWMTGDSRTRLKFGQ